MKADQISVCICTLRRRELLARALDKVTNQLWHLPFTAEIVVVDNDDQRSAEEVVGTFRACTTLNVVYDCEPIRSISLARNRAIRNATGNLLAFIDDDEYPGDGWLVKMYSALKKYQADGVLGPVLPDLPAQAPAWLKKGKFCERRRLSTGSLVSARDARTGNILFSRSICEDGEAWFDPSRGRTGGEDGEFLGRQMKRGRRFVWCDEAVVYEAVPEERWTPAFYLRKYLRIGTLAGERLQRARSIVAAMRASILLFIYCFLFPFTLVLGRHVSMKVLTKVAYNTGFLFAFFGFSILRYRE